MRSVPVSNPPHSARTPVTVRPVTHPSPQQPAPTASGGREVAPPEARANATPLADRRPPAETPPPDPGRHSLRDRIGVLETTAAAARVAGDETTADRAFRAAMDVAFGGLHADAASLPAVERRALVHKAACLALACGEAARARQLVMDHIADSDTGKREDWNELLDYSQWPDAWLVAAVRCEPPDMTALNTLVERTWKPLFARCRLLTLDYHQANDLAQHAWARVLRVRRDLKPGGNPLAYLTLIATNLWRDAHRAKRRAGALADHRLASLDEPQPSATDTAIVLADVIPDAASAHSREHALLMQDVDHALAQLSPLWREVVLARFVAGESCASIGLRHGRTEQTVSGWLRSAVKELKRLLAESGSPPAES